jgi:hypothetical protein
VAFAQQRFEGGADPPAVDAAQITPEDRLIHLAGPPRVPREQSAAKLGRRAIVDDHSPAGRTLVTLGIRADGTGNRGQKLP